MNEFQGFVPPIRNYFPMPNMWIDICAEINNLAELKVIQYVLRHTWGYKEYDGTPKTITTDEFMFGRKRHDRTRIDKGTGLSNKSVVEGLKRAVEHGYLICEVDDSDKGRVVKAYALSMATSDSGMKNLHTDMKDLHNSYEGPTPPYEESTYLTGVNNLHTSYEESTQAPVENLHSRHEQSTHRTEKETLEKHSRKTLEERNGDPPPSSLPEDDSFVHSDLNLLNSQDSGLHIASQSNSSQNSDKTVTNSGIPPDNSENSIGVETRHSDTPKSPGYKTSNSETPHSDAVMENSTALDWVQALASKEQFFDLGKPEKREEAIKQLKGIIGSEKDLKGLYDTAREIYGGIIHLTNLTHLRVVNKWLETKPEYEPSGQGMTLEERNQARQDVWDYCEDIALNQCEDQGRWFVGVFISKDSYFELGAPGDWKRVPPMWKAWAVQYGRRLSEPQQQREAIAV